MGMGNDYLNFASLGVLGNGNPADNAMQYYQQIPGATQQYYQPYMDAGKGALNNLQGQYGDILNNPGGKLNDIGANYHQSPGFQFALKQALQGAGHAAAAGGMAGSAQHEQQNMGVATGLANQDYNNWLGQATGLYGQGLQGEQGLAGMGANMSNEFGQNVAQSLAQQGNLQFTGDAWQQQMRGQGIKNWADLAGTAMGRPWR